MTEKIYTHKKVQDELEVMEAINPSLSLLAEEYSGKVAGRIVFDKVATDEMTNQPIYKMGAEKWDIMDVYQKYKSMEPDAEERKYEAMIKDVVRAQKRR